MVLRMICPKFFFLFGSMVMGHLPLDLQTATFGRSDERYFVGIAHDFNTGIHLYCPINKSIITRHSYKFLDTITPHAPVYVISDSNVAFNTSLPDDSLSSDTASASSEVAGPTSLHLTVFPSFEEVRPTLSEEA